MHVRMHACFSYVYSTRIQRVYAAVHSYSFCLLGGAVCSLGVIAYILLYIRRLPSSSTVMHLVRLSYKFHLSHFSFSSDVVVSLMLSPCRVLAYLLIILVLCSFCT